jgi:hypothetical protein
MRPSRSQRPARLLVAAVCVLALLACSGSAQPPAPLPEPAVSDQEALQFAQRAERFYKALEGVPLPATITYTNRELHQYFPTPAAYADYYSSLATMVRQNTLRDGMVRSVRIREFHFDGPDQAVVEVSLTGKHERELRFWDIDLERRDVWRRIDGVWMIVPEKL